jgi:hypothetical protein
MPLQSVQKTKNKKQKQQHQKQQENANIIFILFFNITNIQATVKVKTKSHYCSSLDIHKTTIYTEAAKIEAAASIIISFDKCHIPLPEIFAVSFFPL